MCDTLVAAPSATADGCVLFAKNSDREPGEAQVVEIRDRREYDADATVQCTWLTIPQAHRTFRTVLCRPFWMWGAEMGANERGVAIGNQAVFTRFEVADEGLTGMDLVRIGLERAATADEAVDVIIDHIERFGQGGRCDYRHRNFRYHSSFVIADASKAWILETAGPFWAAREVDNVWSLSNALSIGADFDRISDGAVEFAEKKGWVTSGEEFGFAQAFADRKMDLLAGARQRRQCTLTGLTSKLGRLNPEHLAQILRNHGDTAPTEGLRMTAPCAHASWLPTRTSGQTVGSMISRLGAPEDRHWLTGTTSPCLSIFKPLNLVDRSMNPGPQPGKHFDAHSLFWRHEIFHRNALLADFAIPSRVRAFIDDLQRRAWLADETSPGGEQCTSVWEEHREQVASWASEVDATPRRLAPSHLYWRFQNWLDRYPSPP